MTRECARARPVPSRQLVSHCCTRIEVMFVVKNANYVAVSMELSIGKCCHVTREGLNFDNNTVGGKEQFVYISK